MEVMVVSELQVTFDPSRPLVLSFAFMWPICTGCPFQIIVCNIDIPITVPPLASGIDLCLDISIGCNGSSISFSVDV